MHEIVQWATRQDEMKIAKRDKHTEKAQGHRRTWEADEIQTPQRKGIREERRSKTRVLGCVGGRSVGGRGRWKSEELQMMYGAENPLGFTSLGFGSDGCANLGTRMA
jgi:hypothetical protein